MPDSMVLHGVPGTPISGAYVSEMGSLGRLLAESPGRVRDNCSGCGRFVYGRDVGLVYDDYMGAWESDPWCQSCRARGRG